MKQYLQLGIATFTILSGIALLFIGVTTDPEGVIDASLLVAYGESLTFGGGLLGIDYHYRYKGK